MTRKASNRKCVADLRNPSTCSVLWFRSIALHGMNHVSRQSEAESAEFDQHLLGKRLVQVDRNRRSTNVTRMARRFQMEWPLWFVDVARRERTVSGNLFYRATNRRRSISIPWTFKGRCPRDLPVATSGAGERSQSTQSLSDAASLVDHLRKPSSLPAIEPRPGFRAGK